MKNTRQSYHQVIMAHLMAGKSITTMQAFSLYKITCLPQRISELRANGIAIQDEFIKRNGKRFKRYWIDASEVSGGNND